MKHYVSAALLVFSIHGAAFGAPAQPAEPTAQEKAAEEAKKKAEDAAKLQKDRAKMEADHKAEAARLTPEIHAQTKALVDKAYPSAQAALKAALAGKHRKAGNADRDKYRHPVETLTFLGLKPTMTVIELSPGEGWYTELLAPTLAKKGKLFITNGDPNGPIDQRRTYYAQRTKLFLDRLPEAYGKVETITTDDKAPNLGHDGQADMVLLFRELHGMVNGKRLDTWLAAIHKALKTGGVLGIEQHRAKPDAVAEKSSEDGYLPEKWVIEKIEAAGFKLAGKSEVNANKNDTKDYPEGVWTLPPSFTLGDKDRAKYAAIGESDRMTLKFVKVAPKK
jgi:predicted methyltransferase